MQDLTYFFKNRSESINYTERLTQIREEISTTILQEMKLRQTLDLGPK